MEFPKETWGEERLMDEFCVMFERAERENGESSEFWVKKLESFITQLLKDQRQELIEEMKRMKLWSKGNVEGTRNDIIAKLQLNK
jgi:DNA-binding ferritin-like protein (Dps family)